MLQRFLRASPRHARRPVKVLPVVACLPGDDVWFLRLTFAFLSHLQQGGYIPDRLSGRPVGNPAGRPFNFDDLGGGPLFWAPGLASSGHLFIGHTICPGFNRISSEFSWWADTAFCAPGYDYLHDGMNYTHVPVDLASYAFASVSVSKVDAAAWTEPRQRAVFIYSDPIKQAAAYFHYCRDQMRPAYSRLGGRPLTDWSFQDYLFRHALPSYAKFFVSYQAMARAVPDSVRIVAQEALLAQPARTLSSLLFHLTRSGWQSGTIEAAVDLTRREHIAAIEVELGRRLNASRSRHKQVGAAGPVVMRAKDPDLRREALSLLASMGVDTAYFSAPSMPAPSHASEGVTGRA